MGVVNTWHTQGDSRVCSGCAALEWEERAIGQAFVLGVYGPPLHDGCRCYMTQEYTGGGEIEVVDVAGEVERVLARLGTRDILEAGRG